MSQHVVNSHELRLHFDIDVLPIRSAASISDIGKLRVAKVFGILSLVWRLFVRALTHKPDLVYFTLTPNGMAFYRDVLYVALMKLSGARRIYHLHGKGVDKALTNPLTLALYKWVFRGAEVILLSPSLYADSARVVRREQCHFLANGIPDPWDGRDYRDDRSCRIDTPRIVFFSNLVVNKGIFVLLEALALLKIRGVPFRASFVGAWESASVEQEFGRIVREKALHDLVEVRGPRHGEEKRQAYAEADIMAFPTYNDSYPLVVLEAMSHALPVISTYEGAIPEILADNITGFLVPRMDALTTADRLELLLTDPALRERMGKAGRKRYLSKFTLRHFEENLRNILEKCLAKNK